MKNKSLFMGAELRLDGSERRTGLSHDSVDSSAIDEHEFSLDESMPPHIRQLVNEALELLKNQDEPRRVSLRAQLIASLDLLEERIGRESNKEKRAAMAMQEFRPLLGALRKISRSSDTPIETGSYPAARNVLLEQTIGEDTLQTVEKISSGDGASAPAPDEEDETRDITPKKQ